MNNFSVQCRFIYISADSVIQTIHLIKIFARKHFLKYTDKSIDTIGRFEYNPDKVQLLGNIIIV